MKITKQELEQIKQELRKAYPVGSTVYTIVRSISRSGMAWTISILELNQQVTSYLCATCGKAGPEHGHYDISDDRTHLFKCGKEIIETTVFHPAYKVAAVTGYQLAPRACSHNAVIVKGCGFDHASDIVSSLSYALYGNSNSLHHEAL